MNTKTTKRILLTALSVTFLSASLLTSCSEEAAKTEEAPAAVEAPAPAPAPAAAETPAPAPATSTTDSMDKADGKPVDEAKKGGGGN